MIALALLMLQAPGREITFSFQAPQALKSVSIVGTFNSWNKDTTPMVLGADGKTWVAKISVPFGHQEYKFVLDGTNWIVDPNGKPVSDGNGHTNTLLMVVPPDFDRPASPTDGVIAASAVYHRPASGYLNYDRGKLTFRLRTRSNDVADVNTVLGNGKSLRMTPANSDEMYTTWEASLPWNRKSDVSYEFKLHDGSTVKWYGPDGLTDRPSSFTLDAKTFQPFVVAPWVEKSVLYQIFPDRFADGDKSNDPLNVQPWTGTPTYSNRFGGDVAGIRQHESYLSDLGITGVYFTPIFKSPSNHRYDATDYLTVDPQFGTNDEFHTLSSELKAKGIFTVMDFAFNHTATDAAQFMDIRKNGQASPYTNWYFIKSYPVVPRNDPPYVAWYNFPSMPKLNVMNPETHDYLLGVIRYWMKEAPGLEGLRFDVANEIDMRFWRDMRKFVKSADPNMWIVGEEWGDASRWLQGDQWDASMNYQFREACLGYFASRTTSSTQFLSALMTNYQRYEPQVSRNQMNLIGSHDTPRFLTLCKGDKSMLELAATVQFSWTGAPTVYYGDELGMEGGADPDNRRPMDWTRANATNPVLEYYKKLIRTRKSSRSLQSGDPRVLLADDAHSTLAYARELDDDVAVVAINRSDVAQTFSIHLPESAPYRTVVREGFLDALSGRHISANGHDLNLSLPPRTAAILCPSRSHDTSAMRHSSRRPVLSHSLSLKETQ